MSVTKTVDIPASHRLTIDVPLEVPTGPVVLSFSPKAEEEPEQDETEYLMRSPANRKHLLKAINEEKLVSFETMEQLDECVRERNTEKGAALLEEARERGAALMAAPKLAVTI